MGKLDDIVGKKIGKLIVYERSKESKYQVLVSCDCNTNKKYYTNGYGIVYGKTKSCGCLKRDNSELNNIVNTKVNKLFIHDTCEHSKLLVSCECSPDVKFKTNGSAVMDGRTKSCGCVRRSNNIKRNTESAKHGLSGTKIYDVWRQMMSRCNNPNHKDYKNYGERGIMVCDEWHNVLTFASWSNDNGYKENRGLSIDRINSDGDYCPKNCEWIPMSENIGKRNREYAKKQRENK